MPDPLDGINPETLAIQQQYTPMPQQVQLEIDKWVKAANLDIHLVKCLISPNKSNLLCILEDDRGNGSYLSLNLLNWEANMWKGTYARIHPVKVPFPIHGFYTPSTPLKSYLTTQHLPPLFIQLYDYLTRKYLSPQRSSSFFGHTKVVNVKPVNAAWVPGMDDISTFIRSELTKTYSNVPPASILGRRAQKKVGKRPYILNLIDTLQLTPVENGTMVGQDFILDFDIGRAVISSSRNTTFNIVAFIINETWRILSEIERNGLSPGIEKFLGENRFKCQWCNFGTTTIIKIATDPKFPYSVPVYEALITCPKCHEKSLAIFSSKESGIHQDARRRLLICENCGNEGLQIVGRKSRRNQGIDVTVHCPTCNSDSLRSVLRGFPL